MQKDNKRHEALQPFSRDHHTGLVVARELKLATNKDSTGQKQALASFVKAWQAEIESHFDEEEQLLLEHMEAIDQKRMLDDHMALREYAQQAIMAETAPLTSDWYQTVGQRLNAHIKWEERELFPKLEQSLTDTQLQTIQQATAAIEQTRPRSN